jgi:hypothetical protein
MVHKDIKPSNLLLFENGVVKIAESAGITVIGTPLYQAPEFLSDEAMFESLFGRFLFVGETVCEIAHASGNGLEFPESASECGRDLLTKMLCPDREIWPNILSFVHSVKK